MFFYYPQPAHLPFTIYHLLFRLALMDWIGIGIGIKQDERMIRNKEDEDDHENLQTQKK